MRKSSWQLTVIGFALVITAAAKPTTAPAKYVSVEKASKDGAIHMDIIGKGGHSGYCLKMAIYNASGDSGFYHLEAGRRLHSNDSGTQDILVTKDIFIEIAGKQEEHFFLYGFCCNMYKASPDKKSFYSVGSMADTKLVALAQYLCKADSNHHSPFTVSAIQSAVWVLSDDASIDGIKIGSKDSVAAAKLMNVVAEINMQNAPLKHKRRHHQKTLQDKTEYAESKKSSGVCEITYW